MEGGEKLDGGMQPCTGASLPVVVVGHIFKLLEFNRIQQLFLSWDSDNISSDPKGHLSLQMLKLSSFYF